MYALNMFVEVFIKAFTLRLKSEFCYPDISVVSVCFIVVWK